MGMIKDGGCHHSYVKATSRNGDNWYFSWLCEECGHSFPREPDGERKHIKTTTPTPIKPKEPPKPKWQSDGDVINVDFGKKS